MIKQWLGCLCTVCRADPKPQFVGSHWQLAGVVHEQAKKRWEQRSSEDLAIICVISCLMSALISNCLKWARKWVSSLALPILTFDVSRKKRYCLANNVFRVENVLAMYEARTEMGAAESVICFRFLTSRSIPIVNAAVWKLCGERGTNFYFPHFDLIRVQVCIFEEKKNRL